MSVFRNFTGHDITLCAETGEKIKTIPSNGRANVKTEYLYISHVDVDGFPVPVLEAEADVVNGLPEPEPDTYLIVSGLVLNSLPDRRDLLAPSRIIRDPTGKAVGCRALLASPVWEDEE